MNSAPRAAALTALLLAPGAAPAQEIVVDPAEGAALYASFCATCHGPTGEGDGPTAEIMTLQPANLTRLAAGNGGVFPHERVVRQIDGRDLNLAHGGPMPLYGPFFEGDDTALKTAAGQPILTSGPIAALVAWLETVQVAQ
jgi:mono/diheme cytochrome c family protein